jgi:hypothetical protein
MIARMISFEHLEHGSYTYAEAKEQAAKMDEQLGFRIQEIERSLQKTDLKTQNQEAWIGLDVQSFSTPYWEIRTALELLQLQPADRVIDLGCGYGRMAHVIGRHYPSVFFIGYELLPERVQEAQRVLEPFHYANVRIEQRDLVQLAPIAAQHYFVYDYGSNQAIEKTLGDLREISSKQSIQVIARGRASRHLIFQNHPWLCEINPPRNFDTFTIFRS